MSAPEARSLTALGVRRPVLIAVANFLIMLAGLAAILGIEVRELPDIDRPIVTTRAVLPGASPQTMDAEVTSHIEAAIARVSGVQTIRSSSEENNMRIRAEFEAGADINQAANDIREAVTRMQRRLPDAVEEVLVIKADEDASDIVQLAVYSDKLSKPELAARLEKIVVPQLLSIDGVADVNLRGNQPRVLRVLIDPPKLAAYNLTIGDIITVLQSAHFDVPAGNYESEGQELLVRALAPATTPETIAELFVTDTVRIGDLAQVFFAPAEATSYALLDNRMVIGLGIVRQAGSNTIEISNAVKARAERINAQARDFQMVITSDDAVYISGALREVGFTLGFAIAIVLVVIAVFLGQTRATLIPAVTMPIALIGTLAAIWMLGFSINLLTLLALVLATGLIVDDAIVVLENIQRLRALGYEKMAAAVLGTRQVFFAVIATTISLVSVFLPIAFLPGQTGMLFREFGLVLAIAVVISSFVAVTLCPMMASRLPHLSQTNPMLKAIRSFLDGLGRKLSAAYFSSLEIVLKRPAVGLLIAAMVAGGGIVGFLAIDSEVLPREDRGVLAIVVTGPDGASVAYADQQARKVEAILKPYQDQGIITNISTIVGRWDPHRAYIEARLAPWSDRSISQNDLAREVQNATQSIAGAQVRVRQRNSLGLRGSATGLDLVLLGNDYDEISDVATGFADALKDRIAEIDNVRIEYDASQAELSFLIDREAANDLNVPLDRISQTMKVMVDKFNVTDLSIEDQSVPVFMGAADGSINGMEDLLNVYVMNDDGSPIPLSALVTTSEQGVAAELDRFAQRRSIELDCGLTPGAPLGQIVSEVRILAAEMLPPDIDLQFRGDAATLEETSYDMAITFVIAFVVIFLVLAAQFESIGSAFIVIFTVPFGLAAAIFALLLTGQTLNLYSQIGLVLLIGLMAKNAILMVEFMDQMRDEGRSVQDAILEGVRVRLRPVMMTVLSTVLGALPLVLGSGPGAEARSAIGWVIFGGLGLSTLFTLYLAPLGYGLIAPHLKPRAHAGQELERQLRAVQKDAAS